MEKHASKRDPNEDAADVVKRSTAAEDELPADVEASWTDWIGRIQKVDDRVRTLLRAAFEAGVAAAGRRSAASTLGRLGAKKGGEARAASLSGAKRKAIAKKAAKARWRPTE